MSEHKRKNDARGLRETPLEERQALHERRVTLFKQGMLHGTAYAMIGIVAASFFGLGIVNESDVFGDFSSAVQFIVAVVGGIVAAISVLVVVVSGVLLYLERGLHRLETPKDAHQPKDDA
ncbi:MAG: hypothetical protein AAF125_22980 [Chloroflexota bacterium]